jgi:hypothetical protein
VVGLGHPAESTATLRSHSNLQELGLRHSPGGLVVVVSRCTTASYGELAQYAVSQCVTLRKGRFRPRPPSSAPIGLREQPSGWQAGLRSTGRAHPYRLALYGTVYYI